MNSVRRHASALSIATAASLAAPGLVAAWDEPASFRGIPWLTPFAVVKETLERNGERPFCDPPRFCTTKDSKIGPAVVAITYMSSRDGRFEIAQLSFDIAHYKRLQVMFWEKYGPPSSVKQPEMRNKNGLKFHNEISKWHGERVSVELRRYGAIRIDRSMAIIGLAEAMRETNLGAVAPKQWAPIAVSGMGRAPHASGPMHKTEAVGANRSEFRDAIHDTGRIEYHGVLQARENPTRPRSSGG